MFNLKEWKGLFMNYNSWCELHNINPKHKDEAYFLYSDRWMVTILPLFVLVMVLVFGFFMLKDAWMMLI